MIFTSLGLLLVALGLLLGGIAKSSVALLTLSLVATGVAAALLLVGYGAARRVSEAAGPTTLPGVPPVPGGQPYVMYVPVEAAALASTGALVGTGAGGGNGHPEPPPLLGYEDMTAAQVVKLVESGGLSESQLAAVETYERNHADRKTVLASIERIR